MKLYTTPPSGNAYKVRLLLELLRVPYETVLIDFKAKEHKGAAFLKINPRGQVPVIEDDGRVFWDSSACLAYIARKHGGDQWLPSDAPGLAEVTQWLALSNNEIHYGCQWARATASGNRTGNVEEYRTYGRQGLQVLEGRLAVSPWLALGRPTVADIACYPYVALAPEGGLALDPYPATRAWIQRIEGLPGWVPRV